MSVRKNDFLALEETSHKFFAEQGKKINYIYIADIFCDEQICLFGEEDQSFYYDDDHLNDFGANKLQNLIQKNFSNLNL